MLSLKKKQNVDRNLSWRELGMLDLWRYSLCVTNKITESVFIKSENFKILIIVSIFLDLYRFVFCGLILNSFSFDIVLVFFRKIVAWLKPFQLFS